MSFVDAQAGRVLDALDANGFADTTAVAFWGDHGWNLGEHGAFCKQSNFETVARIPTMLRVPWLLQSSAGSARRQPSRAIATADAHAVDAAAAGTTPTTPTRCKALVEAVDLFPTLLDVAGLDATALGKAHFEGDSFAPVLRSALQGGGGACAHFKNATFTQYPRCGATWRNIDEDDPCTQDDSATFAVMGYSIFSADGWRYTRWMHWTGGAESGRSMATAPRQPLPPDPSFPVRRRASRRVPRSLWCHDAYPSGSELASSLMSTAAAAAARSNLLLPALAGHWKYAHSPPARCSPQATHANPPPSALLHYLEMRSSSCRRGSVGVVRPRLRSPSCDGWDVR